MLRGNPQGASGHRPLLATTPPPVTDQPAGLPGASGSDDPPQVQSLVDLRVALYGMAQASSHALAAEDVAELAVHLMDGVKGEVLEAMTAGGAMGEPWAARTRAARQAPPPDAKAASSRDAACQATVAGKEKPPPGAGGSP